VKRKGRDVFEGTGGAVQCCAVLYFIMRRPTRQSPRTRTRSTAATTAATTDADGDDKGGLFTGGPDPAQVLMTMMRDNTHRMTARNQKRTLRDAIYCVLQEMGGSLRVKEILGRTKKYVFRRRDGSVSTDEESMGMCVMLLAYAAPSLFALNAEDMPLARNA